MPQPISTTLGICWLTYATLQGYAKASSAVSSEAVAVGRAASAVVESAERSQALFGGKTDSISRLWNLVGESIDDVDMEAAITAEQFLRALPPEVPLPEFGLEPDGGISFDWIDSKTRVFSLSIGNSSRLSQAWIDGSDSGYGVVRFDGYCIPKRILDGINSIIGYGASLRAA